MSLSTQQHNRYARKRLFLGITNVGWWVVLALAGLIMLPRFDVGIRDLAWIALSALVIQSCFDAVGGWVLRADRTHPFPRFLEGWARGCLLHTLVLSGMACLYYLNFQWTQGFAVAIVMSTLLLASGRLALLRAMGAIRLTERAGLPHKVLAVDTPDPGFTGGIAGIGKHARIILPSHWFQLLSKQQLDAEIFRRQWQLDQRMPQKSLLAILGWNLAGYGAGAWFLGLGNMPWTEALLMYSCWMTLWGFLGLLILPSLSRGAVFAADKAAAAAGFEVTPWITRYPQIVAEDGSSNPLVESIFYPVPSAANRLSQLNGSEDRATAGVGGLARTNLYLSWATLTLLGRSVHCNAGRPALWVYPPTT